jgi:hypothetical protein
MRSIALGIFLALATTGWTQEMRISAPAVGVLVDPATGRLATIEGVSGRLSTGRTMWDKPVDRLWTAAGSRAIVQSAEEWFLLEWDAQFQVTRALALESKNWSSVIWNDRGSAWLACAETEGRCVIGSADNGAVTRQIEAPERLFPLALADSGDHALLSRGETALLWAPNDALHPVAEGASLAAAFAPGESRLAITNDAGMLTLVDASSPNPAYLEIDEGSIGVSWMGAQKGLTVAGRDGSVQVLDESGRIASRTSCDCRPSGLWRVGRSLLFRLQDSAKQAMYFVDFENGDARISAIAGMNQEVR